MWCARSALLLAADCGGVASDAAMIKANDDRDRVRLDYTVSYKLPADSYDEATAGAALARCTSMEGAAGS